ncbi:helix-turn-helix domain-containing protein [Acinetobacter sp. 3657]|uniref:helix-turn-helix domain-containing protein n=1 Tax=Acinetobacter sp. 3657 TaxID=2817764 RepID=UPI0028598892|nr:HTH-type transcriptional regulator/antitoxin HigA [Prolinoborus sp. 3657]
MNAIVQQAIEHWKFIAPVLTPPNNDNEYDALVSTLDELLDITGDDEDHPLSGLVDRIGDLIAAYDDEHYRIPHAEPHEVLAFLMEQHHLTQSDLFDVAPQSVISEILNGHRQLNANHIKALTKRFGVSADVFF